MGFAASELVGLELDGDDDDGEEVLRRGSGHTENDNLSQTNERTGPHSASSTRVFMLLPDGGGGRAAVRQQQQRRWA